MELRPFRSLRYSPQIIRERGLPLLIAPPAEEMTEDARARVSAAAPENIGRITAEPDAGAAELLRAWLADGVLIKERRPGLWIYRRSLEERGGTTVLSLLVGLVRLDPHSLPEPAHEPNKRRLAFLAVAKADLEPSLFLTRAPLTAALATTRRPDLSAADAAGVRHDAFRVNDYAQHVELQGLVKNAEAVLAGGIDHHETAREFAKAPAAVKLPGARYKLCAILEEQERLKTERLPQVPAGLFGVSLEDPVY